MNEHPSEDIRGSEGNSLEGKTIVLGVTGSVAAIKASDIARKLIRQGADVWPVMTRSACELIHPNLLEWATGHRPITELTGQIEHVNLVGNVPVHADLILVAPATANTIGKIAAGIDDTPVTTFVTTAFGEGIPLVIVPAMHLSMYDHPFVQENIEKLRRAGVSVLLPRLEEGKAKVADETEILDEIVRILNAPTTSFLAGKKVVITVGRTVEPLDPIRVLTNNSSGKMGLALAEAARRSGAEVIVLLGKVSVPVPPDIRVVKTETADEMNNAAREILTREKVDLFLGAAAVGDWKPAVTSPSKIPTSKGKITIDLVATPKIIDQVKDWSPSTFLVAFRAQAGLDDRALAADAETRRLKARADLIAVNDTAREGHGFEVDTNEMLVLDGTGRTIKIPLATKKIVAEKLLAIISERL